MGWGNWLGTGNSSDGTKQILPFREALVVAQSLRLASSKEWRVWCKEGMRPANMPAGPDQVYKHDGWEGWGHWLGTGNTRLRVLQEYLPFKEALDVARSLQLATSTEWRVWCEEGMRPPTCPCTATDIMSRLNPS